MEALLLVIPAVAAIIAVNIWHRRHKAKMTPDERKRYEAEIEAEAKIW